METIERMINKKSGVRKFRCTWPKSSPSFRKKLHFRAVRSVRKDHAEQSEINIKVPKLINMSQMCRVFDRRTLAHGLIIEVLGHHGVYALACPKKKNPEKSYEISRKSDKRFGYCVNKIPENQIKHVGALG